MFPQKKLPVLPEILRQKRVVIAIIAILVMIISLIIFTLVRNSSQKTAEKINLSQVCSSDLIGRASTHVNDNNLAAMEVIEQEIVKIDTYDSDANCVYILARHALMRNNAVTARKHLERLKKVYVPYNSAFTTPTMKPDELERTVVFLENYIKRDREQTAQRSQDMSDLNNAADAAVKDEAN